MPSCLEFTDDLSAFIDGELDAARQAMVESHLGSCSPCAEQHQVLRETISFIALSKLAVYAKCPDIWTELQNKLPSVCRTIEEDFSAYLDGELIVPAKEGVSEHLAACLPCHDKFQELSQVNTALSRSLELPASIEIDIWSQVKSRLDADCQLIKDDLSSFFDREVSSPRHRTVTSHLLECNDCRDQLSLVSQSGDLIRDTYLPEIPEDFDLWPEIKAKMQVIQLPAEKRRKDKNVIAFPRPVQAIGAAAVVIAGLLAALTFFLSSSSLNLRPVTAESYLIESALGEPADMAEAMVYENQ